MSPVSPVCQISKRPWNGADPQKEGQTGLIYLEEDEETIGTMLAEIYGVENTITGPIFASFSLKTEIEQETILATILKLFIATDKVGLLQCYLME